MHCRYCGKSIAKGQDTIWNPRSNPRSGSIPIVLHFDCKEKILDCGIKADLYLDRYRMAMKIIGYDSFRDGA